MSEIHYRHAAFKRAAINEKARTVELSFSSEEPVQQHGEPITILDHEPTSVDLARLNDKASLLNEHDRRAVVGVVEKAWIADRKGRAVVRFGTSALANEIWEDVKAGVRSLVSVGYQFYESISQEIKPGVWAERFTKWEPIEISIVAIPLDFSVGIGRSLNPTQPIKKMSTETEPTEAETAIRALRAEQDDNAKKIDASAALFKRNGHEVSDIAIRALGEGWTIEKFRAAAMDRLNKEQNQSITPSCIYPPTTSERSIGDILVENPDFRNFASRSGLEGRKLSLELKGDIRQRATATTATITNYSGITHAPGPIEIGVQQATVADLLSQSTTDLGEIPYLLEDTLTNAATTVAEGSAKPEATWDWSQQKALVKKIAVTSKVSDELLSDVPQIRAYIDNRLRYFVEITEDAQILTGDGIGANLTGILATSGIQTQPLGADTKLDSIRKAITKVQSVGFFAPDGIVMHPNDWEEISLLKDANNQYYAGGPFFAPYGNGGFIQFQRLWGLPVVVTTSMTQNTVLVGAFKMGGQLIRRKGLTLDVGYVNDDFKLNLLTLRAETRLALAIWRPKSFVQCTGF